MKFAAPYGASPGGFPCPESCPGQLSPVPSPSLAVLVGALVYPDHGSKRHQIALPPRLRRIESCRASSVQVWLYRWLIFRFLFLAGVMKLVSGDLTWRNLTALDYHFWTQPLPTPLAWYAAQLPHWVLACATATTLVIELGLVFLIWLPRRPRAVAAWAVFLFQLIILLTGNYNFFNLLTMLLCVFLFDDAALRRVVQVRLVSRIQVRAPRPGRVATAVAAGLALIVVPVGLNRIWQPLTHTDLPLAGRLTEAISPLLIVNPYGLFVTTTTARP